MRAAELTHPVVDGRQGFGFAFETSRVSSAFDKGKPTEGFILGFVDLRLFGIEDGFIGVCPSTLSIRPRIVMARQA